MKPKLCALLKVLLCFLLFYCLRDWIVFAYRSVLEPVGLLLLSVDAKGYDCDEVCSLRLVAYLSLVVSTPNVNAVRRLLVGLVGFTVFICIDLASIYLWSPVQPFEVAAGETLFQLIYAFVWGMLRDLLLPVLMWVVIFDRHLGLFFPDAQLGKDLNAERSFSGG